ncbi:P-loop NTPase, partial [Sandarakinorhabdus sp.]|uniref:P-loop NTPase n=1 Tax=Sandarakinorhabdus sp. TaxID=1916663 RepID=UPI00286DCB78
ALPGFDVRRGNIATATADLRQQRSPALLFVDVAGIDRVFDAVQALSEVSEPQLQVVVIGETNDVSLFRGLLRLGVSDYLFKPVTSELLEQLVIRLTGGRLDGSDPRLGKLVAVTGARGGVGTSSIAANLAHYLAEKAGRRVALLDLDLISGAQPLLLGVAPNAGLADALEAPGRIDDLFLERATISVTGRLDLMASEVVPERAPIVTAEAVAALLVRLQRAYHYVIVDVPKVAMVRSQALLDAAPLQILVNEATLLAARDSAARQQLASAAGQRQILVHNMAGRPGDLADADFAATLKRPPDVAVPFLPQVFGQAINMGQPAWASDPRAEAGIALLARELSGQGVTTAPVPAWKRWLGLVP